MLRLGEDAKRWWPIAAIIALIVLSITALLANSIVKIRQDALDQARLRASYLSAALEKDAEGSLDTAAVASEFVKRRVETEGNAAPLAELKQALAKYMPELINITVIGPDGHLLATSGDVASSPTDFSQFDFFIASRDNASSGFRIGKPVSGLLSKQVVTPETQRLEKKDGVFAGVLLFSIEPERTEAVSRRVHLGNSGSLVLVGTDGTIFSGYTLPRGFDPSLIGIKIEGPLVALMQGSPSGSYTAVSPIDGIERVYSWRRLKDFALVAVVGLGRAEALASANRLAMLMSGLGVLSVGLLLALTAMLGREISHRVKQALALEVSRRKLMEVNAEYVAAKRQAEQANQSKSLFLANISHELRTPLTAIIGFAELMRDRAFGKDLDHYARFVSDIYEAGTHLLDLIGNLLDRSKIEAGKFELHETTLDLSQIETECLRLVRGQAENRSIELTASPERAAISLYADETALKRILLNVLSNAIKFTPEGGSIRLGSTLDADRSLTLAVKDSGIGMTEDEIRQALEPFRQVQSALSQAGGGTGLGLPLAVQFTELHGGSLSVESHPGQGTTVSIHFPAWRVNPDDTLESLGPPEKEPAPPSAKN